LEKTKGERERDGKEKSLERKKFYLYADERRAAAQ
jgi:hypothetical protein